MIVQPKLKTSIKGNLFSNKEEKVLYGTVDGRNPAPPQRPWKDDSPVNTNKQWLPWFPSGAVDGFRPSTVSPEVSLVEVTEAPAGHRELRCKRSASASRHARSLCRAGFGETDPPAGKQRMGACARILGRYTHSGVVAKGN